jgi:hypothetical protein
VSPVRIGPEGRTMVAMAPKLTPGGRKLLDDFEAAFMKAMDDERTELAAAPKVHDPSKREYVEEIDPALADKYPMPDSDPDPNDRSHYLVGDETDFVFVDGQDGAHEDERDDDDAPPTGDLVARARALLTAAANEAQPLDLARFHALESEVALICLEADEPDDVRSVIAPELAAMSPK